jgi:hypothetical protein
MRDMPHQELIVLPPASGKTTAQNNTFRIFSTPKRMIQ